MIILKTHILGSCPLKEKNTCILSMRKITVKLVEADFVTVPKPSKSNRPTNKPGVLFSVQICFRQ